MIIIHLVCHFFIVCHEVDHFHFSEPLTAKEALFPGLPVGIAVSTLLLNSTGHFPIDGWSHAQFT